MDSASTHFSLNPCSSIDGNDLLVSLKLNSQLQSLLESGGDSGLAIEFTSLTTGKIYCGSSVFDLKFSDSTVLEVYRGKSLDATCDQNGSKKNELNFLGTSASRYHVLTSIENASEELQLKRKRELDTKDQKSMKNVELMPKKLTRSSVSFVPFVAPAALTGSFLTVRKPAGGTVIAPAAAPVQSSSNRKEDPVKKKPKQKVSTEVISSPIHDLKVSSKSHDGMKSHPHWLLMSDLPDTACGFDVREFLEGFKIRKIYGYYQYNPDPNGHQIANNLMDVYVYFESKSGVKAAMLRNGETIRVEMNKSNNTGKSDKSEDRKFGVKRRVPIKVSLHLISASEASWAKALSVKLENSLQNCRYHLDLIRSAFPSSLLSVSPSSSDKKWSYAASASKYPPDDEICTYSEYQKKMTPKSNVHRYNYHNGSDYYLDPHQMCGTVGYSGLSGLGSHLFEPGNTEIPLESCLGSGLSHASPIYGITETIPILNESIRIVEELSGVTSQALINSYSTISSSECNITNFDPVLDLAHRMSSMYLTINNKLKSSRYLYSNLRISPVK